MSQGTSIKTDTASTGNVFNKSHPRHTRTYFIRELVESELFKHEIKNKSYFIYTLWGVVILSINCFPYTSRYVLGYNSSLKYSMKLLNVTATLNLLSLSNVLKITRHLFKIFDIFN